MSLTLGKVISNDYLLNNSAFIKKEKHQKVQLFFPLFHLQALPRRRVSVAVVPKFNLLNIPGQTPAAAGPGSSAGPTAGAALPVLVSCFFFLSWWEIMYE